MMPLRATPGADQQRAADDDDDVVAEAGERFFQRNDADRERGKQRQRRDEIVAQPPPDEGRHHQRDDGEGEQLGQCEHGNSRLALKNALMRNFVAGTEAVLSRAAGAGRARRARCPSQPRIIRKPPAGAAIANSRSSMKSRLTISPAKSATPTSRTTAAQRMTVLKKVRPTTSSAGACTTRKVAAVAVLGDPPCAAMAERATPAAPQRPPARIRRRLDMKYRGDAEMGSRCTGRPKPARQA